MKERPDSSYATCAMFPAGAVMTKNAATNLQDDREDGGEAGKDGGDDKTLKREFKAAWEFEIFGRKRFFQ